MYTMPRHGDYYSLDKLPRWRPIPVITGPGERRGCKKRDRPCCTPFHLFPFNDALVIGTVISRHLRKEYPLFFLYIWLSLALDSCNRWIIIDFSRFFILLKRVSIIVYIYIYTFLTTCLFETVSHLGCKFLSQETPRKRKDEPWLGRGTFFFLSFLSLMMPRFILVNGGWQSEGPGRQERCATLYEHPAILMRSCFP